MNILLLSQFFSTTRGGGEYVFKTIAKTLAKNGHKVWIITNKIHGEQYKREKNIEIILVKPELEYKGGLPPGFLENLRYSFNSIITGFNLIHKEKIDLIHSNNFAPALAGSILSFLTSRPHIIVIHDVFSNYEKDFWKKWSDQSGVSSLSSRMIPFFEKLMTKLKHNCVHTVSEATKDDLIQLGEKKPIHVIHNVLYTTELQSEETIPNQFVYVGRLVFYKNLEIIIKAIDIIRKDQPKIRLVIVGDGPYREVLEEQVLNLNLQSNIDFKGYVSAKEKNKLISQSNALLFPSLCEGFGLVILEAFSQIKPVLVSNVRPLSDIVSHEKTGYVLDPYDENIWAEHILKLAKNPQESERMGKNGNELLKTKYNQDLMFEKIMKMYNDVLSKR